MLFVQNTISEKTPAFVLLLLSQNTTVENVMWAGCGLNITAHRTFNSYKVNTVNPGQMWPKLICKIYTKHSSNPQWSTLKVNQCKPKQTLSGWVLIPLCVISLWRIGAKTWKPLILIRWTHMCQADCGSTQTRCTKWTKNKLNKVSPLS